jgi:adenylylsulfate kinase-like enzyme
MHGEQGALLCTAKIVETVPWIDAKYYAATQVVGASVNYSPEFNASTPNLNLLRRVAEVARLVNNQGLIAIAALVAPKQEVRARARELVGGDRFVEVFVDTPLEVCRERDENGMYEAADRGEIPQFPGVSATYDRPTDMDLRVDTLVQDVDECVDAIMGMLAERGYLNA